MGLNFNQFAKEANTFLKEYTKELNLNDDTIKLVEFYHQSYTHYEK